MGMKDGGGGNAPAWLEQVGAAVTTLAGGGGASYTVEQTAFDRAQAEHEKLKMLIQLQSNSDPTISNLATKKILAMLESGQI